MNIRQRPHFRARIEIFGTEAGGPNQGYFGFPESGMRALPSNFLGVSGLNTLIMYAEPNLEVRNGSSFEADCRVLAEEFFTGKIDSGTTFHLWDGRDIARGQVLELFHDNWGSAA